MLCQVKIAQIFNLFRRNAIFGMKLSYFGNIKQEQTQALQKYETNLRLFRLFGGIYASF